ncbi:MAG: hypothetical protein GX333_10065 [Syntrophomonadaceae bacterium]|nr:hypothetical protein [Syntrophomonadaceae bacterium]
MPENKKGGGKVVDSFGLKIGIEGEKEFKNALREINQSFRVLSLWDGIASVISWVKDKTSDFVRSIIGGIKGLLGIKSPSAVFAEMGTNMALGISSPSKVFRDEVGLQIGAGFAEGINKSQNMYMRRKNFIYDSQQEQYVPVETRKKKEKEYNLRSAPDKVRKVIKAFAKENPDPKEIAK